MQVFINVITSFFLYSILASGIRYIYSTTKILDFILAISISLASYFIYQMLKIFNIDIYYSISFAVILTSIFSVLSYKILYRHFLKDKFENWKILIASIGAYLVLQNLVSIIWGDSTLSFRSWEVKEGHQFLGAYVTDVQIITIISCIILLLVSWWFIEKTKIGQQIKAISSNPQLSSYYGISTNKVTVYSFALGSGLAACAGILIAADTDMTPTIGFNWLLYGVVAMIIGGMGKMRCLLLGALLLATAQHISAYYLDSKWMNATAYVILIAFLYFRPYGFSGQPLRKSEI